MALIEHDLFRGKLDKVKMSIQRLKQFEPEEGYYLAFSGGKDSIVIKHLADVSGVKYDGHYNLTTVDPPELVQFIKREHKDISIDRPEMSMWELIPKKKIPPTRLMRYCCEVLKERGGKGRKVITGIRKAESYQRSNRKMVESCYKQKGKTYIHPIIDWTDSDVWEYIRRENIKYCKLYDEGFERLGCIGCPMAGKKGREMEFERYPKYKQAYIRAFQRMLDGYDKESNWKTGEDVFNWWMEYTVKIDEKQNEIIF